MAHITQRFHLPALVAHYSLFHLLVAITVIYLIWQISLGGAILTADSAEKSQRLGELARNTVGFGMFLFVFRTCWSKFYGKNRITSSESIKKRGFWPLR